MQNPIVRAGRSGPPLHIHYLQTEFFQVKQGVLGAIKNGKEYRVTKEDGILTIPAGTRHRFWAHDSGSEDLVFHVWAEPQDLDNSFDQKFLRNFQGYLADCQKSGIEPSFLQIVLLLHGAATVLSPPFWVPIWLLRMVSYVLARWVAAGFLGYQSSYPEYTQQVTSAQPKKAA